MIFDNPIRVVKHDLFCDSFFAIFIIFFPQKKKCQPEKERISSLVFVLEKFPFKNNPLFRERRERSNEVFNPPKSLSKKSFRPLNFIEFEDAILKSTLLLLQFIL